MTTAPNISTEEAQDPNEIERKKITTPEFTNLRPNDSSSILQYAICNKPDSPYELCTDDMTADGTDKCFEWMLPVQDKSTREKAFRLTNATNTLDNESESNDVIQSMYLTTVDNGIDSMNEVSPVAKREETYDYVTSDPFQLEEETTGDYETTEKRENTYLPLYTAVEKISSTD